ncbi:hypothetical protein MKW11_11475 [Gluconobacter frateurii]|uniref:hypothetical protein n=1 Tax=Gluconobacter frateurii TaxID=38308 RepID=UPI001F06BA56|nr:hypothetical protein [Gluconobacter frateurii]UMM07833.1 hypothetical protein MKW11_11475 [Gluconobacter frateurii]
MKSRYRERVNMACLDGTSPFDFPDVPVMDGINHPNDISHPERQAGVLRFERAAGC